MSESWWTPVSTEARPLTADDLKRAMFHEIAPPFYVVSQAQHDYLKALFEKRAKK